jgi:hypothetical protein
MEYSGNHRMFTAFALPMLLASCDQVANEENLGQPSAIDWGGEAGGGTTLPASQTDKAGEEQLAEVDDAGGDDISADPGSGEIDNFSRSCLYIPTSRKTGEPIYLGVDQGVGDLLAAIERHPNLRTNQIRMLGEGWFSLDFAFVDPLVDKRDEYSLEFRTSQSGSGCAGLGTYEITGGAVNGERVPDIVYLWPVLSIFFPPTG